MMFAIITPALITGAFANRVTFKAYFWFLTFWLIFVYFPFVHMLWSPDGILAKWGCLDFAGGIVVHASAGFAALASVLYVGRRHVVENNAAQRSADRAGHGIAVVRMVRIQRRLGTARRRGDRVGVPQHRRRRVVRRRSRGWSIEWARGRQPKFVGLLTGAVAGLATITPAAGYVSPSTAVIIGIAAGVVCYFAVALKNQLGWDDALDVWGVHGVGGFLGICLLGVFASTLWNPSGADGLLARQPRISSASSSLPRVGMQRLGVYLHLWHALP